MRQSSASSELSLPKMTRRTKRSTLVRPSWHFYYSSNACCGPHNRYVAHDQWDDVVDVLGAEEDSERVQTMAQEVASKPVLPVEKMLSKKARPANQSAPRYSNPHFSCSNPFCAQACSCAPPLAG